jgi:riboflavin kinase/FMN adenylyltransferase
MKIIDHLDKIKEPFKNAVITIGNFDGVHIGHQALFHEVIETAENIGGTSIAMTFDPHPIRVLKQNGYPPLITLYEQKAELIGRTQIDVLICIPFSRAFAALPAESFVRDLLVGRIGMKAIVVGEDYSFGKNREGNIDLLKAYAPRYGFEVIVADWIRMSKGFTERISSTRIRQLVKQGLMEQAEKMLGRYYQIRGRVVTGRDRGGKLLGIPTANVNLHDELCPKTGIYAVTGECRGQPFKGVANIGYSPTFENHEFTVEVHIFDFDDDIYGEIIRVNFVKRIRDEIKFANIPELIDQINKDIAAAREILSA